MCVDYYEIKDVHGNLDTQNRLKVLTFMGETQKKSVINVWKMAEQLDDYLQNYNYNNDTFNKKKICVNCYRVVYLHWLVCI